MKTKEDAAKVLLENGFSLNDVLNLLGNQRTVIYPYIPTIQPYFIPAIPWGVKPFWYTSAGTTSAEITYNPPNTIGEN